MNQRTLDAIEVALRQYAPNHGFTTERREAADAALATIRADARALWAVRVLDTWRLIDPRRVWGNEPGGCVRLRTPGEASQVFDADTPDAARIAAADAVAPELGDRCPRRPV